MYISVSGLYCMVKKRLTYDLTSVLHYTMVVTGRTDETNTKYKWVGGYRMLRRVVGICGKGKYRAK